MPATSPYGLTASLPSSHYPISSTVDLSRKTEFRLRPRDGALDLSVAQKRPSGSPATAPAVKRPSTRPEAARSEKRAEPSRAIGRSDPRLDLPNRVTDPRERVEGRRNAAPAHTSGRESGTSRKAPTTQPTSVATTPPSVTASPTSVQAAAAAAAASYPTGSPYAAALAAGVSPAALGLLRHPMMYSFSMT